MGAAPDLPNRSEKENPKDHPVFRRVKDISQNEVQECNNIDIPRHKVNFTMDGIQPKITGLQRSRIIYPTVKRKRIRQNQCRSDLGVDTLGRALDIKPTCGHRSIGRKARGRYGEDSWTCRDETRHVHCENYIRWN